MSNILVVGGSTSRRTAVAESLHREGRLRFRAFQVLCARRDQDLLRRSLLSWLGHEAAAPPLACDCGTLFVDDICELPLDVQRLLLSLARRLDGAPAGSRMGPGPSRLAAGSSRDPAKEVAEGRLLAALLDSLDKLTIRLGAAEPRAPSARR